MNDLSVLYKSKILAALLTALFGAFGMFYISASLGFTALFLTGVVALLIMTLSSSASGASAIVTLWYIATIFASVMAVSKYNKRVELKFSLKGF